MGGGGNWIAGGIGREKVKRCITAAMPDFRCGCVCVAVIVGKGHMHRLQCTTPHFTKHTFPTAKPEMPVLAPAGFQR